MSRTLKFFIDDNKSVYMVYGVIIRVSKDGFAIGQELPENIVEITGDQFNLKLSYFRKIWSEKKKFVAKTKYTIICDGYMIEGFSNRPSDQLSNFLFNIKGGHFEALNKQGKVIALIGPDITERATYTITSINS